MKKKDKQTMGLLIVAGVLIALVISLGFFKGIDPWTYDTNNNCFIDESEAEQAQSDWAEGVISVSDSIAVMSLYSAHTENPNCGSPPIPPTIDCYVDTDCGSPFIDPTPYCGNDNILVTSLKITPKCFDPGTTLAVCVETHEALKTQICEYGCENGACKTGDIPWVVILLVLGCIALFYYVVVKKKKK